MPSGSRKCPDVKGNKQIPIIVIGWGDSVPWLVPVEGILSQGLKKASKGLCLALGHSLETAALNYLIIPVVELSTAFLTAEVSQLAIKLLSCASLAHLEAVVAGNAFQSQTFCKVLFIK